MPWTTPGTAIAGAVLTASYWNTQVRDNMSTLVASGSALPGAPGDGESFYYIANAGSGIVWHFRYRSSATGSYKWEVVGGQGLASSIETSEARNSRAYGDLATVGPTVTVPLDGDYIVTIGNFSQSSGVADVALMSYAVGASVATDARSTRGSDKQGNPCLTKLHTGVSAGTSLVMKYRNLTGSASFADRYMTVVPVRVG